MVGVTALITVLAVMTGFDQELRAKILGNRCHLTVQKMSGPMENYEQVVAEIDKDPEVVATAPFVTAQTLLQSGSGDMTGAIIWGIDPDRQSNVTEFSKNLKTGTLREHGVVLGSVVAQMLQTYVDDTVNLVTARRFSFFFGDRPAEKRFVVTGIYSSGMYDYDSSSVFLLLKDAQKLAGLKGSVSGIQVRLLDPFKADEVGHRVINELGSSYWGQTWIDQNRPFWYALKQEKIVMFVILTLVIVVAAFNIVSTLIMVVMEKRRDIGVLRSVGTPTRSIMGIFMFEGLTVGVVGTVLGLIGGITLARSLNSIIGVIEEWTGWRIFSPEVYIFEKIPVSIQPSDVILITVSAILISFSAAIYPAWQASRLDPIECLRYE
jgi:lipoprotein-releasing system permease protein